MKIEDIINQINFRSNPKSALYFELFIQNLLKLHLEKQGKQFISDYVIDGNRLDGYSTNGIGNYEGSVAFEIKYTHRYNPMIMRYTVRQLTGILDSEKIKHMILIYPADSDKMRYFLRNENPNLILWGITEINGLIDANKEEAEYIANSLFKLEIKKELNRRDNDWKKSREELLTSVKKAYKKGNISLLLGAGVSL